MVIPILTDLTRALALHAFRQRVLANDLANTGTPDFQAQDVASTSPFGRVLQDTLQLARTDPRHLTGGPPQDAVATVVTSPVLAGTNGNGVDADATLAALSANALAYQALAAAVGAELSMARTGLLG
jgi:flagellar basal-body rod protein FlgB